MTIDDWASGYAGALYQCGALEPGINGRSYPGKSITRAEFLYLIMKAKNISVELGLYTDFKDVFSSHDKYDYMVTAEKKGLVNGFSDGTFRPDDYISRNEALKMALEVIGIQERELNLYTEKQGFTDTTQGHWTEKYQKYARHNAIAAGFEDETFRGDALVSNAEAWKEAVLIARNVKQMFAPYVVPRD